MIWAGLLFLFTSVTAQELPSPNDIEVIEKFYKLKQKNEQTTLNAEIERISRNTLQPQTINYQQIKDSGITLICIPKGHTIINFKENIQFKVPKPLTVRSYRQPDEADFIYILGKNDELKYKVALSSVEPLNQLTQMYEAPAIYQTYPPREKKAEEENIFKINHQLLLGYDRISSNFNAALLNEKEALIGSSQRYGYSISTQWDSPVNIGAFAYWDNTSYEPGFYSSIISRSLVTGLSLKSRDLYFKSLRFEIGAMFGFTLTSKMSARYVGGRPAEQVERGGPRG
jgi:hypothetical protein